MTNTPRPIAIAIDAVAEAALRARETEKAAEELRCDACNEVIEGEPSGRGLYVWARGDEVRREEPPLCGCCATAIGITALQAWSIEEEEG
ncbi:hypothetical protein [Chondromyces crocatus]|uniref:hypothetical protein n=1 Tax=Chondromyces crocatus TaxID=52 RepID=UPI00067C2884|nr:hypothetical protein [Chondromyces crocatus]